MRPRRWNLFQELHERLVINARPLQELRIGWRRRCVQSPHAMTCAVSERAFRSEGVATPHGGGL